ncbi:YbjQ family protein [Pectobacterium versatile]|nr:YbjQ family protein [Pectobacterium versatile]
MGFFSKEPSVSTGNFPMCFSSHTVPGREIKKSFGVIKAITAEISGSYESEEELVTTALCKEAKKLGANAIVNFRYETGSYQKNGTSWVNSYLIAYGDAVILDGEE